ncbi:hypothetical protein DFH08DRAFT_908280 [Mycena albidolilacea]|uniref:Mannosyltransferase n=1 Tax=Mycena albidolilacea TaxID=1033008 RepID=A0AAD6YWN9_9AGAR|nr:hypothetical protein DFH08DRAFT_908280 [Mycena albidolilacea]
MSDHDHGSRSRNLGRRGGRDHSFTNFLSAQTSPAHAYLTSHLPKLLLSALPLSLFATFSSSPRRLVSLVFPGAVLVGAMSALGHKEWFISSPCGTSSPPGA